MPYADDPLQAALLITAALIVGIAKTSVGGFASIAVAMFAFVMPTKESTAAVLILLILGDIVAALSYRRHADWSLIRKMLPAIVPGIALGALFMWRVDDLFMRRAIGALLLASVGLQVWMIRRKSRGRELMPMNRAIAWSAGTAAGFTTMTANAAGPVMALYLLLARVDKRTFVGTNAWFFLIVNISKTPFSASLGLFPPETLALTLWLAPVVLLGTVIGRWAVRRISQTVFEAAVLAASILASVSLLLG